MILFRDDPIISCMERTGYPPWMEWADAYYEEIEDDPDEEQEDEE